MPDSPERKSVASTPRMAELGEFGWLRKLIPRLYWPSTSYPQLVVGPGDDAAVLRITRGKVLVTTTDAMVEGTHFDPAWFPFEDLGMKILAVNLSDLAAMGNVRPVGALITAGFPGDCAVESVDKFYRGLEQCAKKWRTGFLGGDTVGSPKGWLVSATLLGEADERHLIRRSGAQPGDILFASGPLGLAGAGLEVLQMGKRAWPWSRPLVQAFSRPQPRMRIGSMLGKNQWATSLLDSSDGLEASARLLGESSGVGIEIDLDRLRIHPALERWAQFRKRDPKSYALRGGEDYELIGTLPPRLWTRAHGSIPSLRAIGHVLNKGEKCWARVGDQRLPLETYGFAHFK